ncbi:MAG: peptidyl-tRNA hydrolase [Euryarchaeota archaeon]|jgi:PTH2 family peptidyl-tRNA hydrolase|nr:peptidyl-tRNA hydrolase [Euryarchaeota archaeon]
MIFRASGDCGERKLVILMRNDIKMSKGKMAAQAGHAAVVCALASQKKDKKNFDAWMAAGQSKVVLKVDSERELFEFKAIAEAQSLTTSIICDAGRTEIAPGTYTCLGIGPAPAALIDKVTGELKMM